MKVILLQDVAKVGKRGSVAEVPDGYARNQLIPKRMAEPATPANQKRLAKLAADAEVQAAANADAFAAAVATLKEKTVSVAAEANEQEHLFKAVSGPEVVAAAATLGVILTPEMLTFNEPVKSLGEHQVTLQSGGETATITINVEKK